MLKDQFGRIHNYLRISLTEKCNLRCTYCMPEEGVDLRSSSCFMSNDEVIDFAKIFVNLGVDKIRLTGGEPLVRKDFNEIIEALATLPVELSLTTNAVLLDRYIDEIKKAGIKSINISLDTLNQSRFEQITRRNDFSKVMKNIDLALDRGLEVKLNVVLMKNFNEDEILNFISYTEFKNISVRFIEFMPFDGNQWNWNKVVKEQDVLSKANIHFGVENVNSLKRGIHETSQNYRVTGFKGSFGFISTITSQFCGGCNRIRLTADGKIKNCLFSNFETDLLGVYRNGGDISNLVKSSIYYKKESTAGIDFKKDETVHKHRSMIAIGG